MHVRNIDKVKCAFALVTTGAPEQVPKNSNGPTSTNNNNSCNSVTVLLPSFSQPSYSTHSQYNSSLRR